jgi:hypothetical protein
MADIRDRARAQLERLDEQHRRFNPNRRQPNERLAPIWGQTNRPADDNEHSFSLRFGIGERELDDFDFDSMLNNDHWRHRDIASPRPPAGAVEEFPPLRRMGRGPVVDAPLPSSGLRESWSPRSPIDGLGDRERSFSPASVGSDHWETMLTTIAPDINLPSADSSFTSAAASASFSNSRSHSADASSNSISSSRTSLTVPSEQERERERDQACETDDERPGSPPADELTANMRRMRQRVSDLRNLRRTQSLRRLAGPGIELPVSRDAPTSPGRQRMRILGPLFRNRRLSMRMSPPPAERDGNESSGSSSSSNSILGTRPRYGRYSPRPARRRLGSTSPDHISTTRRSTLHPDISNVSLSEMLRAESQQDSLLRRPPSAPQPSTQTPADSFPTSQPPPQLLPETRGETQGEDLDSLRTIVERLAQRDDIPEEWWMSVGLTPMFAGRIERVRRERETRQRL